MTVDGERYQLQPGWQDINDAVANAKDAKARGMQVLLSFHYSDFWTNPALQIRPEDWAGFSQSRLEQAIYDFTAASVQKMKNAGVTPEYVSIGNEINNALADVDRWTTPAQYFALLQSASKAVKDTSPASKTVIHLTTPGRDLYQGWIDDAKTYGLDYDIMGVSLYPFWTDMSIASLANFASWVGTASGKPVMAMETGYPFTLEPNGASETTLIEGNSLDPDGPRTTAPPRGAAAVDAGVLPRHAQHGQGGGDLVLGPDRDRLRRRSRPQRLGRRRRQRGRGHLLLRLQPDAQGAAQPERVPHLVERA